MYSLFLVTVRYFIDTCIPTKQVHLDLAFLVFFILCIFLSLPVLFENAYDMLWYRWPV